MGLYIHGIKMPKDGCHHMICVYADGTVAAGRREYKAVPVPPHGDLIERSAASLTDFEIVMCNGDYREGMKMLLEKVDNAPIIIPAEEET